jgi:uncharacterized protein (TIGR04222 family)
VFPFDLSGPAFIAFYLVFGALTVFVTGWYVERREANGPLARLTDPLQIAFLRGGANEAMRICALTLIDRGLLVATEQTVATRKGTNIEELRRPLEQAILRKFEQAGAISNMYEDRTIQRACEPIERQLQDRRLLMGELVAESRRDARKLALVLLIGVAALKIVIALGRGRTNIGFLIVLTLVFSGYLIYRLRRPGRTGLGKMVLDDLQQLFQRRRHKADKLRAGLATDEAALLAAVFGLSVLPKSAYPFVPEMFPRAHQTASQGSSCGASCGTSSSCSSGSSSSSSSSSSCSSGGCGGGGCGGCGS